MKFKSPIEKPVELLLWVLFFTLAFGFGYFHGRFRPDSEIKELRSKEIKILVSQEGVVSPNFVSLLSFDTEAQIQVVVEPVWQKFQAKVIANNGFHLILAPSHWLKSLEQVDQLATPEAFSRDLPLAADFPQPTRSIPVAWMATEIWGLGPKIDFDKIKTFHLLRDESLTKERMQGLEYRYGAELRKRKVLLYQLKGLNQILPSENEVVERPITNPPLLLDKPLIRLQDEPDLKPAFMIYSLAIPRNSDDLQLSNALIQSWFRDSVYANFLQTSNLSSTLTSTEKFLSERKKRASYLRSLRLTNFQMVGDWDNIAFEQLFEEYDVEYR